MNIFRGMLEILKNNPVIGFICGVYGSLSPNISQIITHAHTILADPATVSGISIICQYLALLIAVLTVVLKAMEFYNKLHPGKKEK